jgi:hypothetical protein
MITRSKKQQQLKENEFVFDFDDASVAWRANKKSVGNGMYEYKCMACGCSRKVIQGENFCRGHLKK